jgi:DNA-binding NarL/FixJ family response regulator
MPHKIKILIVDDHPLVRQGLVNLISQQPGLEVCGEAVYEAQALELVGATQPGVAIVDLSLERGSGLELTKSIHAMYPAVKVLILSVHDELLYAERALRAGALGYIMKHDAAQSVIQGIRSVLAGRVYISGKLRTKLAEKFVAGQTGGADSPLETLTDRELEILQLMGQGCSTRQIAGHLCLGFKSVQYYYTGLKEKLKLANALELRREAVRWHLGQQTK